MYTIADTLNTFASFLLRTPLVVLLIGGGVFFLLHSHPRPISAMACIC